jgi:pyridoxamine 5'-phosphate oxidase
MSWARRVRNRVASLAFLVPGGLRWWKAVKDGPVRVADMRRTYSLGALNESDVAAEPVEQFRRWFADAVQSRPAGWTEPNAMTLATVDGDGRPEARTVLLKGFDERGFVFYTNHESRKGRALEAHPEASLLFFWPWLDRQVEVRGNVERVTAEETEAYFHSRPVNSQLGAWASRQSEVITGREDLEQRIEALMHEYAGREIPVPPFWGGYRVAVRSLELWQGRPSRLHDRLRYERDGDAWRIVRLSP